MVEVEGGGGVGGILWFLPSLRLSLAKHGAWLLDSWEELRKEGGVRPETSAPSHASVSQSESRRGSTRLETALCIAASGLTAELAASKVWALQRF